MKKLSILYCTMGLFALTPLFVSAGDGDNLIGDGGGFQTFLENLLALLNVITVLIIALAVVFFLWGVAKFILNAGDPEEQSKGKSIMFWGLIGLFVMTAVWGLVNWLGDAFGLDDTTNTTNVPDLPELP